MIGGLWMEVLTWIRICGIKCLKRWEYLRLILEIKGKIKLSNKK